MRAWLFISIAGMAMILCTCTDTFLVYKKGKGYFLGTNAARVVASLKPHAVHCLTPFFFL